MLNLLNGVLRAVRPRLPDPEPARVRRFPKRYEPIGTDEDGYPVYSRESMREILMEALAVRREAERREAEAQVQRLAQEQAELRAVADEAAPIQEQGRARRRL